MFTFLAGEPDPPVQAGAASVARVTLAVVAAVAGQRAAGPEAINSAVWGRKTMMIQKGEALLK